MGLLDCVSDKSGRYPVNPPESAPMARKDSSLMGSRRSIGKRPLFASNTNLKGKDVDHWRHRVLRFLYRTEGREDVRELRMPLKQLGYTTIGDFIRDIPPSFYEPYRREFSPDTGLKKDYKVIWDRDGIAESGIFKWAGDIDGQKCIGLQLDRKKAVPFGIHDGKGLFFCKPGHRALVPADEVFPYKQFLRDFIGLPPRKDSMALNLLPGKSSVRVAVAKKYKPGDRVRFPNDGKWATILWTGRIDGEWVVDLVYDPEKPPGGKVISPDEPCLSKSLSMAEFIDEVGIGRNDSTGTPVTPPPHVPTPPPKSADCDDEVFVFDNKMPKARNVQPLNPPEEVKVQKPMEDSTESDETSETSEEESTEEDEDVKDSSSEQENDDPGVDSESEGESKFKRTFSEPIPLATKRDLESKSKGLEVFETPPLKARSTHKPLFNLAFGTKSKKAEQNRRDKQKQPEPYQDKFTKTPKKETKSFFSSLRSKSPKVSSSAFEDQQKYVPLLDETLIEKLPSPPTEDPDDVLSESFSRRDSSRSPVHKMAGKIRRRSSDKDHREVAIDVPSPVRTPVKISFPETHPPLVDTINRQTNRGRSRSTDSSSSAISSCSIPSPPKLDEAPVDASAEIAKLRRPTEFITKITNDNFSTKGKPGTQTISLLQVEVPVEINNTASKGLTDDEGEGASIYSDSTPPYSPAIKDVGLSLPGRNSPAEHLDVQSPKKTKGSSSLKSFTGLFSSKKKALPPKDYHLEETKPEPPVRKESLEHLDRVKPDADCIDSEDESNTSHLGMQTAESPKLKPLKKSSGLSKSLGGFFSRKPKTTDVVIPELQTGYNEDAVLAYLEEGVIQPVPANPDGLLDVGIDDGLTLEPLEVKDVQETFEPLSAKLTSAFEETTPTKGKKGTKGKPFSFGFSKKSKQNLEKQKEMDAEKVPGGIQLRKPDSDSDSKNSLDESKDSTSSKSKRNSLKESFSRTFSFTKNKRKGSLDKLETSASKGKTPRPQTMYVDNNEVIGATNWSKSRSTSALVDIKPWDERKGNSIVDIYGLSSDDEDTSSTANKKEDKVEPQSPSAIDPVIPALVPKPDDVNVPKHRMFTTPWIFRRSQKSVSDEFSPPKSPKRSSFKEGKVIKVAPVPQPKATVSENTIDLSMDAVAAEEAQFLVDDDLPPLPKSPPPPLPNSPPPRLTRQISRTSSTTEEPKLSTSSPSATMQLKSALKQRKEIEAIPQGIKIGDRVIWYNGRMPVPGTVMKLYKDGTDKYTAVVKFDREPGNEPLSLVREGEAYIVTVEELITPEAFGIPPSTPTSVTTPQSPPPRSPTVLLDPAQSTLFRKELDMNGERAQTVRFESPVKSASAVPNINIQMASPEATVTEEDLLEQLESLENQDSVPPPFQQEEVELCCGLRRGIPCVDQSCCLETLLFSMFYTTNTFDTSVLYHNGFDEFKLTRDVKNLLRNEVVSPLRQSGYCDQDAIKRLKIYMSSLSPDFSALSTHAEVVMFILFERALKLGKFITYSTGLTDYLHQIVLDPRDFAKSSTIQQMLETSLEHMDNLQFKAIPTPALILEIPRANDKLVHYQAVIPNLSLMLSHKLQNGPKLCICGMVATFECDTCQRKSGDRSIVYCDSCKSTADQIHFNLNHQPQLNPLAQLTVTMDLMAVLCVQEGHYTSFVKCGSKRLAPWLFYDAAELDNPKVSLEHNLGMWLDRLEKYPGKYGDAMVHPLLTHFLTNGHICIYQSREKSSLV